jgi:hypothetical protein
VAWELHLCLVKAACAANGEADGIAIDSHSQFIADATDRLAISNHSKAQESDIAAL